MEITIELLRAAMEKAGTQNFLIDGFPRNKDNLDGWNRIMEGVADVKFVLFFDVSEQVFGLPKAPCVLVGAVCALWAREFDSNVNFVPFFDIFRAAISRLFDVFVSTGVVP